MSDFSALGFDIGSTTAKVVAIDDKKEIIWHYIETS